MAGASPYRSMAVVGVLIWIAVATSEITLRDEQSQHKASRVLLKAQVHRRTKAAKAGRGRPTHKAAAGTATTLDVMSLEDVALPAPGLGEDGGAADKAGDKAGSGRRRRRYGRCSVPADTATTSYSNCNGANARRRANCVVSCKCGHSGGSRTVTCHADGHGLSGRMPPCADIRRRRSRACTTHGAVANAAITSCTGKKSRRRTQCKGYCVPGFAPSAKAQTDTPGNVSVDITCEPSTTACHDHAYAPGVFPDSQMPVCKEVRRRRSKICTIPATPNVVFESCRKTSSRRREKCPVYCAPGFSTASESHKNNPQNVSVEIECRPGSENILEEVHPVGTYDTAPLNVMCTPVRRRRTTLCHMPEGMTDRASTYTMAGADGSLDFSQCANTTSRRRMKCNVTCSGGWRPAALEATPEVVEIPTLVTCMPNKTGESLEDLLDKEHHPGRLDVSQYPKCVADRRRRTRACYVPGIVTQAGSLPAITNLDFSSCSAVTSRRRTSCSVGCALGYEGDNATVTCREAHDKPGLMNYTEYPACPAKRCSPPANLTAANYTQCSNVTTGNVCRATCALGYSKDGQGALDFSTKLCTTDGSLSGPAPTCQPNTCANRLCPACPDCLPAGSCSVNFTQCAATLTHQNCTVSPSAICCDV